MNVQELIDALNAIEDKSVRVIGEGCDCANPVVGVEFQPERSDSFGTYKACVYLSVDVHSTD